MNFKVRCLNNNTDIYEGISEGNIYEIIDGKFLDDNGTTRPFCGRNVNNFEEFLKVYGDYCEFELVEDISDSAFSINDIKPCMLVELRKGTLCMVMETKEGKVLITRQGIVVTHLNDNVYDKNLEEVDIGCRYFDIMKVWGFIQPDMSQYYATNQRELLWEREDKTKMTLAEIEERLGMKIEII